jgi:hypothetical protein
MPQINKGDTFANGEQVTGTRLNQLVDSATILPAIITDQTNLTANTVATVDSVLLYDLSATALREATASDLLNSNLAVTTSSITGGAGVNLVITPASTYKVDVAGAFEADSSTIVGAATIGGTLGVTGAVTASSTLGVTGALTASSTLAVTGTTTLTGAATASDVTASGTVNITGAIQFGGTVVYSMYEVTKHTATTAALTKGADEIWVINASDSKENPTAMSCVIQSTTTLTGVTPPSFNIINNVNFYEQNSTSGTYAFWSDVFIIPVGTTFTAKTIAVTSVGTSVSVFTITKYKTA